MARWKALPEDLDPEVRDFVEQLRRLVDRSGLGIAAVSDRTGYSKTSWERYLNGRILAPKGAIVALAEATGNDPFHLTTLWELAERAWSRAEARHDRTMEQIRISQARAALGVPEPSAQDPASPGGPGRGGRRAAGGRKSGGGHRNSGHRTGGRGNGGGRKGGRLLAGAVGVGALAVVAALIVLLGGGDDKNAEPASATKPLTGSSAGSAAAPDKDEIKNTAKDNADAGAAPGTAADDASASADTKCTGDSCTGSNPEAMGCGGTLATTVSSAKVGGATMEVRYSKACRAAWARITEATPGDTLDVSTGGAGLQKGVVDAGGNAFTAMTSVPEGATATACATVKATGGKTCTDE